MTLNMVDATSGNQVLLERLMVDFCCAHDNQAKVVVEL
jgi:very-short-patch-repair endonuclease